MPKFDFDYPLPENSTLRDLKPVLAALRQQVVSRRDFLKLSFLGFAAATMAKFGLDTTLYKAAAAFSTAPTMPNGVAAGDTTQTSTVLWAHSTALGPATFEYATAENFETILGTLTAEVTDATLPIKVEVADLTPVTDYFYRVTDAAGNTLIGSFRTAAALGMFTGLRFGVTGDWRQELAPYPSIANAADMDLEFMVGMGDTIYADFPSPDVDLPQCLTLADFRAKHNEGYGSRYDLNTWAALRSQTSFIPTIDDHEVTNDFAGGAAPGTDARFANDAGQFINDTELYRNGLQAFLEYNPIRHETWGNTGDRLTANKPNLYRYFTYGSDAAVFVLDARSFRSAPLEPVTDFENLGQVLTFYRNSFDNQRSMLGLPQLEALTRDLLQAQTDGILWKFVMMPEPCQNLGLAIAQDRFEGYAAERAALMKFIVDNGITNVVFVAADIHGTLVNNITYQLTPAPKAEQLPTGAWEISTGSVAFDAPFGPTVIELAIQLGFLTEEDVAPYRVGTLAEKEAFMARAINAQIEPLGYPLIGLDTADGIDAELLQGAWTATSTFGWTLFEIAPDTQQLHVTTFGIDPYTRAELEADPQAILSRVPQVVQEFTVNPVK
ncbi:MAG: alkaline phosphatase D family protein [Anaerolineae bacterium]|nr:alkaline phosphatase D family protein [Anaerolineae bacterium]